MNWEQCTIINRSLDVCKRIASTNFYGAEPSWISEAALALLLINLKDALQLLDRLGERISFDDEIEDAGDVTDLVAKMRNAICHIGSPHRLVDSQSRISLSFGTAIGKCALASINGKELANPHGDDVAFFYGALRIYLKRHIHRAISEADATLVRLAKKHGHHLHR